LFDSGLALKAVGSFGGVIAYASPADVILDGDFMSQGSSFIATGGAQLMIGTACVYDAAANTLNGSAGHGVLIGAGGYKSGPASGALMKNFGHAAHRLWGSGNAAYGLKVGAGSKFVYTSTVPTVTGTSGDFILAAATTVIPQDPADGTYKTTQTTTWANLALGTGSAGFGGNCVNPRNGAGVVIV
jgi:hypothetical protein